MQHHETQTQQPEFDDFGAEPLTDSGFDDERPESEFDDTAMEPGEEERQ